MYKKQKLKKYDFCFRRWSRKSYGAFNSMHKVVKVGVMTVGASIVMLSAQTAFAGDTLAVIRTVTLDEIVVTGQRNDALPNVVRTIAVITKVEVEPAPLPSLNELLRTLPSLDLRQRGPLGTQADLSIRGGTFDQTQILLNGINFSDPQTGHYGLDLPIDLTSISRAEVLQGLSAPGAIGGALNLSTADRKLNTMSLNVAKGAYGYLNVAGDAALGNEKLSALIAASHRQSDGYMANTDFQTNNLFGHLLYATSIGHFEAQLGVQDKAYGANGFYSFKYPDQFEQVRTLLGSMRWKKDFTQWNLSAAAYYRGHLDRFELFRGNSNAPEWYAGHNYHQTAVSGGEAAMKLRTFLGETALSFHIRNEHIYSNVLGLPMAEPKTVPFEGDALFTNEAERLLLHAFLSQSYNWQRWALTAALSYHYSDDFGSKWCLAADLRYNWTPYWTSFVAVNQSLRLPTFTDLYYTTATHEGNPNLQPEEAVTYEIGTAYVRSVWFSSVALFYRQGRNLIDWVYAEGAEKSHSLNYSKVDAMGAEFRLQWNNVKRNPDNFFRRAGLAYSFTRIDKASEALQTSYALDYLRHKLTLNLEHRLFFNQMKAFWQCSFQDRAGTYTDYLSGAVKSFEPFALLNFRLTWDEKQIAVFAELNNIFDTAYFDYAGLPQPGLWWQLGVNLKIW